jgi:cysteine desulfurase
MIYLDHHATTPVDPVVLDAMLPYFSEKFGNAASRQYRLGWETQAAVDEARASIAGLMGAEAK